MSEPQELRIRTTAPQKWRLVDLETEQVWRHEDGAGWVSAHDITWAVAERSEESVARVLAELRADRDLSPSAVVRIVGKPQQ